MTRLEARKASLRQALSDRAPRVAAAVSLYLLLRRAERAYARASNDSRDIRDLVRELPGEALLGIAGHELLDVRIAVGEVVASQKRDEVLGLLDRVAALRPRAVCEIGTSAGGTLYLLTRVAADDAIVVSVDIAIPPHTRVARAKGARPGQQLVSVAGNSHDEETRRLVERSVAGRPLDVLFIDGDHSYAGVRADFELYAPLVRPGGLIALHDIQPDARTRHGAATGAISGEVPVFWTEIKRRYRTEELIADADQDGYGIGIVYP